VAVATEKNVIQQSTGTYITVRTAASILADETFPLGTKQHRVAVEELEVHGMHIQ
jgi:hypothetical protein